MNITLTLIAKVLGWDVNVTFGRNEKEGLLVPLVSKVRFLADPLWHQEKPRFATHEWG